jgi:tetratricopeptide (TPR) repeat protein
MGVLCFHRRQFPEAREQFAMVLEKARQDPLMQMLVRSYLASISIETEELDKAAKEMSVVEKGGASTAAVLALRAYLSALQGKDLDKAEATLAELVKQHPSNALYRAYLGWILAKRGRAQEGLALLKEVETSEMLVRMPAFFDNLGDVYLQSKRPDKASEAWRIALRLFPRTSDPKDHRKLAIIKKLNVLAIIQKLNALPL